MIATYFSLLVFSCSILACTYQCSFHILYTTSRVECAMNMEMCRFCTILNLPQIVYLSSLAVVVQRASFAGSCALSQHCYDPDCAPLLHLNRYMMQIILTPVVQLKQCTVTWSPTSAYAVEPLQLLISILPSARQIHSRCEYAVNFSDTSGSRPNCLEYLTSGYLVRLAQLVEQIIPNQRLTDTHQLTENLQDHKSATH